MGGMRLLLMQYIIGINQKPTKGQTQKYSQNHSMYKKKQEHTILQISK